MTMKRAFLVWPLCAAVTFLSGCDDSAEEMDTGAAAETEDTAGEGDGGSAATAASASGGGSGAGSASASGGGGGGTDGGGDSANGDGDGSAGETYPPICMLRCLVPEDCNIGGRDVGFTCKDSGRCEMSCEETSECQPVFSGWHETACESDEACNGGHCMDLGNGAGGCAIAPSDTVDCASFGGVELTAPTLEGESVVVCGDGLVECTESGRCSRPGADCNDEGCPDGFECAEDGRCGCTSDDACIDSGRGNTCAPTGGCVTVCDGPEECSTQSPFDGGEAFCEEP